MKKLIFVLVVLVNSVLAAEINCVDNETVFIPEDQSIKSLTFMDDDRINFDECIYDLSSDQEASQKSILKRIKADQFIASCYLHSASASSVLVLFKDGSEVKALEGIFLLEPWELILEGKEIACK